MGALHPEVVHFTIVLAIVGVAFRLISLLGKPAFASPAATTLILLAATFSWRRCGLVLPLTDRSNGRQAPASGNGARGVG